MRTGRVLAVILLAGGLIGVLVGAREIFTRLLYISILLICISWLWAQVSLRGLSVNRRARSLRASVGDVFEEYFELVNESRLGKLWVEVSNDTNMQGASGSRLLTVVGKGQKRTYIARTWLVRRGGFRLGPTRLVSGDPFGLFRREKVIPAENSLVVLPMIYEISAFISPPGLLPGGQVIRRKAMDITPHASGVREYVPGDPMKRIHWPTTARRGQLIVKEFEQDPQAEVWLFLDAQAGVHAEKAYETPEMRTDGWLFSQRTEFKLAPSTLEYAISITASLAHYFLRQRRAVGLVTAGRNYAIIPAERSQRQENKILETLAFIEAETDLSIAGLVAAQAGHLPQGSSAILVTPTVSLGLLATIDDLQRRDLRTVVVLLMADSFGGPPGSKKLYTALLQRNVSVCSIYCDADIALELSGFSSNMTSQDSTWQRPPLSHLI
ncbi:MAG: DUF58 domain-containing protein [Anaerolineales bacterium]|nr:DUF58 domain-containing protein [Anaerolineales bacterium]